MSTDLLHLAVFAYNFPHKKTQDIITRMTLDGLKPDLVLATDPVALNFPGPTVRVKPRYTNLLPPNDICKYFNIEYCVINHNSPECIDILKSHNITIGVIAGARILGCEVITAVSKGIINLHPGLLPDGRGLDALQWAILEGRPIGVTSHVIDEKVDKGFILWRQAIEEYPDDTLIDLSLRLDETQVNMVSESVRILNRTSLSQLERVENGKLHKKMPPEQEKLLVSILNQRLNKKFE